MQKSETQGKHLWRIVIGKEEMDEGSITEFKGTRCHRYVLKECHGRTTNDKAISSMEIIG
jgi:hypothetical protein